jgi:hypothetical protein
MHNFESIWHFRRRRLLHTPTNQKTGVDDFENRNWLAPVKQHLAGIANSFRLFSTTLKTALLLYLLVLITLFPTKNIFLALYLLTT